MASGRPGKLILGMNETKVKNLAVAGSLGVFVVSVYAYTMKAVGKSDEIEAAVQTLKREQAELSASHSPNKSPT